MTDRAPAKAPSPGDPGPPLLGAPVPRVDGPAKVTGEARYSADVPVERAAHAVVVGATVSRGRVTAIDVREASAAPGVLAVLTPWNAPRLAGASAVDSKQNERVVQVLQDDQVRYDGQPIAVVVAEALEEAQHAAALLRVTCVEEKPVVSLERELERGAAYTPQQPSGGRPPADSSRGDFEGAFASAPVRVEATYTTPFENHNPMETHATVAVWSGPDRLTLYDATQWVFAVRKRVAQLFGLPQGNVRVISKFVGGAFGCKGTPWSHVFLAAMAAKVTGRAVRLVLERSQMFHWVGYRPRTIQTVSLGARKDGTLVAVRHDCLSQTSRFDEFMEPSIYATRMLYACPNVRTSEKLVRLDVQTPTFMRAPGEATGSFALESAMDELSYALGVDPLALRQKNYAESDDDEKKPYSSKSLRECYRQGAERFGWSRRKPEPRATREGRELVGWGMATATYPARQFATSARASLERDGRVLVQCGTLDIGTGTYTVMTQLAAETLGIPVAQVRFELGDSNLPHAWIEAGSSAAASVGSAVKQVCLALREKVAALGSAGEPLAAIAARQPASVEVSVDASEKATRKAYATHSFGAHFAEVRVDEDLGSVRVTRVVGAFAAGRILNARTAHSQLLGGVVWGLGMALLEETVRDERTGRVVNKNLEKYRVPVNADVR